MKPYPAVVAAAVWTICLAGLATLCAQEKPPDANAEKAEKIGRPVRVVSLSFSGKPLEHVARLIDAQAARGADLIVLPETWTGKNPQALDGPATKTMAALAAKHRTYIVSPIYRRQANRRLNSAVLLDRQGKIACIYDKIYPYWSEFDLDPPCAVGADAPVYDADFGKLGMAICFDVNFPDLWKRLADQGAELVVWPSAYSAGTTLQAHALIHHFYIVTATLTRDCIVYDITGQEIHYQKSDDVNVSRITLDLDRGIYHQNFNIEKRDKLLAEHPDDVVQEKWMDREQWFVLSAKRPGISARALARQYGLEELRHYINRSRTQIDKRRTRQSPPSPPHRSSRPRPENNPHKAATAGRDSSPATHPRPKPIRNTSKRHKAPPNVTQPRCPQ